mmetsp:Transcript_66518/g.183738  ORF Transcript_66518/g.183738 Transcript_66518/m.183738 type:complete len:229 (-) Transcript_66518:414-1100(-)
MHGKTERERERERESTRGGGMAVGARRADCRPRQRALSTSAAGPRARARRGSQPVASGAWRARRKAPTAPPAVGPRVSGAPAAHMSKLTAGHASQSRPNAARYSSVPKGRVRSPLGSTGSTNEMMYFSLGSAAVGALAARGASPTPGPIRRRWRGAPASEPSTELLGRFVLRSGGCPAMVSKALASSTWPSFRATLMGDQPSLFTHSGSAEADCTKYWHVALWPCCAA